MVYDICDSLGLARPTFTYTICDTGSGNNSGIKCTAAIIYSHNSLWKDLPAVTCLRAHRKRRNAREDACHDMYIILQSKSGSNHMSKFRFVSDKNAGLSKDMQSEDLSVLDAGAESPVEMQL